MFINCPNCNALVATDLVTDQPPPHCPRCDYGLRDSGPPQPAAHVAIDPGTAGPAPALPDPLALLTPAAPVTPPVQAARPAVRFIPLHEPPRSAPQAPPSLPDAEPAAGRDDVLERATDAPTAPPARRGDGAPADDNETAPAASAPLSSTVEPATADAEQPIAIAMPQTLSVPPGAPDSPPILEAPASATSTPPGAPHTPAPMPAIAAPTAAPSTHPAPGIRAAPSFLRATSPVAHAMSLRERRVLRIAIPALAVLLVLQLLLADRVRLAADATWRPWVAAACTLARCSLPPWHAPDAIALVQRDVRPHPAQPGVLQVSATLRNDAAHPQAWPMLLLTLSDVDGRPLGARWFAPGDYRPADAADTLAPGAAAAFRIDVVEPSPHTVAFNFTFG